MRKVEREMTCDSPYLITLPITVNLIIAFARQASIKSYSALRYKPLSTFHFPLSTKRMIPRGIDIGLMVGHTVDDYLMHGVIV